MWSREDGRDLFEGDRGFTSGSYGEELRVSSTDVSDSGVYVFMVMSGKGEATGRGEVVVTAVDYVRKGSRRILK